MSTTATYPVHVEAQLDTGLSRWLWIFKWVLAIPHYFLLVFLWIAFAVTSVLAFFGILVTGRYPRSLFDFNVGVLRWTWRVAYYTYGALGTDRYPPFTLDDVPDYPAHLEIDYPEHLSRGLVLVKWWLLAIPHYLVIGVFLGGAGYALRSGEQVPGWGSGLIGILVCVAAVVLLFTGRYPQRLFDLVLGLNRWVLRVAGYVALMTDRYPPFALGQGGHEPSGTETLGVTRGEAPPVPAAQEPDRTTGGTHWTGGRVVSVVAGAVLALASLGMLIAAAVLGIAGATARDSGGFLMSPTRTLHSTGYAITSEELVVQSDAPGLPHSLIGDAKIEVTPAAGHPVFVGIARSVAVQRFLGGARHSVVVGMHRGNPTYDQVGMGSLSASPGTSSIWVAHRSGTGLQSLVWPVATGRWTVVIMNADGSPDVTADTAAGAEFPALPWVVGGLAVAGVVLAGLAVVLVVVPLRLASRPPTA
jgi:hypothetical protein